MVGLFATRASASVGVVVVGHGRFAAEMVETLLSVVGDLEGVEGVACRPDAQSHQIREAICEAVERVDEGAGVRSERPFFVRF